MKKLCMNVVLFLETMDFFISQKNKLMRNDYHNHHDHHYINDDNTLYLVPETTKLDKNSNILHLKDHVPWFFFLPIIIGFFLKRYLVVVHISLSHVEYLTKQQQQQPMMINTWPNLNCFRLRLKTTNTEYGIQKKL